MRKYEYVAVDVAGYVPKGQRKDDAISAKLNEVAAYGYRFTGVVPGGQYGGGFAIFERESQQQ